MERLFRNGITAADLEKEFKRGYNEGLRLGITGSMQLMFACVALALKRDKVHFGWRRIKRILNEADQITVQYLTSAEAVQQALKETGLQLDFSDAFERVKGINE